MKAIAINGSPRRHWNTEQLLQQALDGAASMGAQTEMIQLYDLKFTGCRSCFACKIQGHETDYCKFRDELAPVIKKILEADVIFIGSPIYLGGLTGEVISFLERLCFPLISYDDYKKNIFDGHINVGLFYTMNTSKEYYEMAYKPMVENRTNILGRLGGVVESYASFNTLQFNDYSKYHAKGFDEEKKKKSRQEQFPKDLEEAYQLGQRLVMKK